VPTTQRTITAKFNSKCADCGGAIAEGEKITYVPKDGPAKARTYHFACPVEMAEAESPPPKLATSPRLVDHMGPGAQRLRAAAMSRRQTGAAQPRPTQSTPPAARPVDGFPVRRENPWKARHVDAERAFQDGDRRLAEQLVNNEYAGAPRELVCAGCGGFAYWRATVGAMMCPDCRSMFRSDGEPIHVTGRSA
jgi:hypothetical protein